LITTLTGTGFPLAANSDLVVKFGNAVATVISSSNQQLVVQVPPRDINDPYTVQISVTYQGQSIDTSNTTFTYDDSNAPTITGIVPTSASPVLKGVIEIDGLHFGTDAT
jgi:hypothetical protein